MSITTSLKFYCDKYIALELNFCVHVRIDETWVVKGAWLSELTCLRRKLGYN